MVPGAAVVAGPGGGVALRAGISSTRQYKGSLVALQFAQAIVSSTDVFHAVHVVDGAMVERGAVVEAMPGVERHGFVGTFEERRLVHVVPETGNAHTDKILVQTAPPVARFGEREIREDALAGPDDADENRAVGIFDEDIVPDSGIVRVKE